MAARFAAEILPGIFRLDDPCFRLRLAPEGRDALETIVADLPAEVFGADDALGWVYQFWQNDKKDEVNASERKIGGADLGPVTQLFTENYMVRFLLENSLGAWWAAGHPESPLVKGFEYLRFDDEGKPAAGSFDEWPGSVAEVTVMDPCCGSGHFLVEAFSMLWQMRAEEEGLDPIAAQDAVLRDNLFGLELDSRCVQIAMFALALQAWKAGGGWRELPIPNIACSGIPVKAPIEEWTALANGDERLENALTRLHILFQEADTLGSLIDPKRATEISDPTGLQRSTEDVDWEEVAPLLEAAAAKEASDPATAVLGADVIGMARAADFLARSYVAVVTNPPFMNVTRASLELRRFVEAQYPEGRNELATVFVERLVSLVAHGGTRALVIPQNYLFLGSYRRLRERNLRDETWNCIARIGSGGFTGITGEVVNVVLSVCSRRRPDASHHVLALDVQELKGSLAKADGLLSAADLRLEQGRQLSNPEGRFVFGAIAKLPMLSKYVESSAGIQTGDFPRFGRCFWEVPVLYPVWEPLQSTVRETSLFGGRERVVRWEGDAGELRAFVDEKLGEMSASAWLRGTGFRGLAGVAVKLMGEGLPATRFEGTLYDNNVGVLVPRSESDLPAIWTFCSSPEFSRLVRMFNPSMKAEPSAVAKVPFDVDHWRKVAEEKYPDGLPEPYSNDPTQWLFKGLPDDSTAPLQVAVARLLGYRWPEREESDDLAPLTDPDGIVCLPSVKGEPPAADRLNEVLVTAFDGTWSTARARQLLEQAESKKKNLADWLRDEFFKQHCALFQNRPFIWHIWDGQREGFSALVNYHRLDQKNLERLTYTYLGQDWVERQRAAAKDGEPGADARLAAALELKRKLEAILEGEPPYDIYVRWKELREQPIGWDPDLNDGVRLNIRPFVEADVLRSKFNIHWRKDRGKNPDGSERLNDLHLTVAEKSAAREGVGV